MPAVGVGGVEDVELAPREIAKGGGYRRRSGWLRRVGSGPEEAAGQDDSASHLDCRVDRWIYESRDGAGLGTVRELRCRSSRLVTRKMSALMMPLKLCAWRER